ncbi:acyl-CoA carboxylase epsilon subunit [Streptomyces odontomachi]|uniref:acyl-CoA carboxylase epsilon subunit n=1 Tax=Streptomyces odontomachi TaxID=2944940 RepID=UPI00210CFA8C|nr:acyl-CoA carboxylase epsilon subunit [Streptomyces sp. ODS25]
MTPPAIAATPTPIRIERGTATPEELAALTVLLLTRTHPTPPTHPTRAVSPWLPRRFAPRSWQSL